MNRLRRWFTQDRLIRLHFLVSPFGAAAATYGITTWRLDRLPTIADFDNLAGYAGIGVILYGMSAVVVDLGGQAVFYTIAAIIKFIDERKEARNAAAVRVVSSNDELTAQVILENPTLTAQVILENPTLAARVLEQLEREPADGVK